MHAYLHNHVLEFEVFHHLKVASNRLQKLLLLINRLDPETWGKTDLGGWSVVIYPFFFIAGFVIASSEALQSRIQQMRWLWLSVGLVLMKRRISAAAVVGSTPRRSRPTTSLPLRTMPRSRVVSRCGPSVSAPASVSCQMQALR